MQKIPKIYFMASLIDPILIILFIFLAIRGIATDLIVSLVFSPVGVFIAATIILLPVILFILGLYFSFFLFRDEPVRRTYIRWGMYINFFTLLILLFGTFSVTLY